MSKLERDQERSFTRRALLVGGVKLGLFGVIAGRMFQLQVLERDKYTALAEENRVNMSLVVPERGIVFDRFDVPLAVNVQDFRLLMIEERTPDVMEMLQKIDRIVPLSPEKHQRILRDLRRQHKFLPVLIEDNLTWEQMAAIEVSLPHLPGVYIEEGKQRSYPLRDATAHVIGYVGIPNEDEVKKDPDPLMVVPGFQIGKMGLEQQHDAALRGVAGRAEREVNASGRSVRTLKHDPGVPGHEIRLTLDAELQLFVQTRISQERSASAVVLDIYTGAVYALCSHPAYDPNVFSQGIPSVLWKELLEDKAAPLTNKIIAGQYPPGSTFKMITALAALESGRLNEHRSVYCPGHMSLGSHVFHCWKPGGHGNVNLHEALSQSCDVFFYQMALDVGIDKIGETARKFGLGEKLGLDIPGERGGLIPSQAWKLLNRKEQWHKGESLVNAIGQGFVLTTPLQLAIMTARLVNGGIPVTPYLADQIGEKRTRRNKILTPMTVDPGHLALIKAGMDAVVNGPTGTARGARIRDEGMEFGGKTGTAQVRRITMDERRRGFKSEDLRWEEQHHALFVGYAPVVNPRYACAVVVEHGGGGSAKAAPIARDILLETQKRTPEKRHA
jgi:penicillin-binding protein 2